MSTDARGAEMRLATYGSLSPGEVSHGQLSELKGRWLRGSVRGVLQNAGWGSSMGFPGLTLDPAGPSVRVNVFESAQLPEHWPRLDDFEGSEYRRVVTQVETDEGAMEASIYVVAE